MITNNQKTSLLVQNQLPEYVRDNPDYANFSLFLKAYYEWMEENGKVTERSKNILNYTDIDTTTSEFLDYFTNEFLPFFPNDTLISKQEAVKFARELYQSKGTISSYKFLFKILYDSDFDIFYTKDAVLKASDGKWYVSKSLKLATSDLNFLNVKNYRLFGETTKTIATIEASTLAGSKIEVFVSNIERLFQSGEFVRVVDNNNQDVLFDGQPLRAKILGQISQVRIDPKNRGLQYQSGDPVIVYGGLSSNTGIGATAVVGETTAGSIQSISLVNGGHGYRFFPNTVISFTNAPGANAIIGSVDPSANGIANVQFITLDTIGIKKNISIGANNYFFSNTVSSDANTKLSDAFSFDSFTTYPISSILVVNGGGGITKTPTATPLSGYKNESEDLSYVSSLGILSPIQIIDGGVGYQANDTIVFSGGTGHGAYANVLTVNATGSITSVGYNYGPIKAYPVGGMGYRNNYLPTLSVNSSNVQATGASLFVPGILGTGSLLSLVVDRVGSITTINLLNNGEDYIETPNVSLKVQDILVSNVSLSNLPNKEDVIYQGVDINNASYIATVNSISQLVIDADPAQSLWNLRVFNYNSNPDTTKDLVIDNKNINMVMANIAYNSNYNSSGVRNYGDGTAKATAKFLNGLVISEGQYLNSQGQPSSYDVLQSSVYNNYTYIITVQKEIEKYRNVLLNLLHPSGTRVLGRYALKSNTNIDFHPQDALFVGYPLYYYTGLGSTITMSTSPANKSTGTIQFNNIGSSNLANFLSVGNTRVAITPTNGPSIDAKVIAIDSTSNTATLDSNTWLTFANVAIATATSGANVINITNLTGAYDIINNGKYSNTAYPLKDIIFAGDTVNIGTNTTKTVNYIDYANGKIYLTSNITANANTYLTVNRTFVANSTLNYDQIKLYGPVGQQYINPYLTTEDGIIITTEDDQILLVG